MNRKKQIIFKQVDKSRLFFLTDFVMRRVDCWHRDLIVVFLLQLEVTQMTQGGFKVLRLYSAISMNKSMKYDIPSVLSEHFEFCFKVKSKDIKKGLCYISKLQLPW